MNEMKSWTRHLYKAALRKAQWKERRKYSQPGMRVGNPASKYMPHQGEREIARRARHIAEGRYDAAQFQ